MRLSGQKPTGGGRQRPGRMGIHVASADLQQAHPCPMILEEYTTLDIVTR